MLFVCTTNSVVRYGSRLASYVFYQRPGAFNAGTNPGGDEYSTAAFAKDHSIAVLYMPTYRKVGVNMERFKTAVAARWFDPSNGKYIVLPKKYANKRMQYFVPPVFKNSHGFDDWVLVVGYVK